MPTPPTAYDETAKGPGLSGLLEILRRRRVLAVLPFLFVLTAAVSLAVFLPSLWTARSLVLVNRQAIPERYVTPTVQADIEARLLTLSQEILTPQRPQGRTQIGRGAPRQRVQHSGAQHRGDQRRCGKSRQAGAIEHRHNPQRRRQHG